MSRFRALSLLALLSCIALGAPARGQPAGALGEDFIFRVRQGDTLIDLAAQYTRNQANWSRLQTLNKIVTPERLPIGLELHIPLSMIPVRDAQARVVHVSGRADMDGKSLQPGTPVTEGSTVATAPNGFVTLELADGSKLTLPSDGTVELTRLRQFEGTALTDSVINVRRGSVESSVAPAGKGVGRFEVRTPVAVTGVRGTRFRVQSGPQGAHSEVLEGSVRLQAHAPGATPARPVAVAEGYGAAVGADGGVSGLRPLLTAPQLGEPVRAGGAWTSPFPAVAGAQSYLVRVSRDADGTLPVSSASFPSNDIRFTAPGPGTFYVLVRAVDNLGLNGQDAVQAFEGANMLMTSFGLSVGSGTGGFVTLTEY
ncbi:FecR family protein [Achromobacter deleyi]|uniref:FecR family protein n=1 Tax=Achromobacter deleyi TaxID=1353891 RepID=UPI0014923173|nr:FecR domain-containing protein [Achromobacter deleyi]QVQ25505.1 FecR domain-containing protein [Achromobacter deleyi]UIP21046.1 FecR domain-containing protein [Achromobacter deleyi]